MTADNRQTPAKKPNSARKVIRVVLQVIGQILLWAMIITATLALIAVVAGSVFLTKFTNYLKVDVIPKANEYADALQLGNISLAQTSIIYYTDPATGEPRELQQLYAAEHRIWVSIDEIPQDMVNAAVAIEDKRFPEHDGVDWLRTLSAVRNFAGGDSSYGASTITQQLIKNLSQDDDVTVNRKVQEIFRALAVEKNYTKDEIMEWYLNTIYLGEGCYGVQSASEIYFGKDVSELSTAECASIIAITNNPSLYDPYINPENNRERQLTILMEMHDQGYIESDYAYDEAASQEMLFHNGRYDEKTYTCSSCGFEGVRSDYYKEDGAYHCPNCSAMNYSVNDNHAYSYFVDTIYRDVVNDLCEEYDISENAAVQKLLTGGYSIYSTINPAAQAIIDTVYEDPGNVPSTISTQQLQSAIVLIDNTTGDIVAMSGGVGEKEASLSLNRATQSKLPTGSSIKPISVYAPALEAGVVTPATVLDDSPFTDDGWPQNDSRSYGGPCTVLHGLVNSLNTMSVKTLDRLGTQNSYDFLTQKMGITTLVQDLDIGGRHYSDIAYAPLALGELTYGLTVREMTQAYATFPNGGVFREARTYTKVVDPEGKVVLDNTQESHTAISAKTDFYINYMLTRAVSSGTGNAAYKGNVAVAGKTGTSNNNQTRWFAGYTPYYTAVVWCGYDEPEQIRLAGSYVNPAISMWKQVMDPLHDNLEYREFPWAEGVDYYSICTDCGKLATDACEMDIRGESRVASVCLFSSDAPTEYCSCHVLVRICRESGDLANEYCDDVYEVGMIRASEAWAYNADSYFVYDPDNSSYCSIHTESSGSIIDEILDGLHSLFPSPASQPTTGILPKRRSLIQR